MTCWGAVQEEGRRARSRQLALRRSAGSRSNFSLSGLSVCLRLYVHRHWLRLDLWTCYRCGRKACTASCRAVELTCRSDGGKGVGAMMAPVYGTVAGLSTGFHSTATGYWQCPVNRQNHDRAKLKTHSLISAPRTSLYVWRRLGENVVEWVPVIIIIIIIIMIMTIYLRLPSSELKALKLEINYL